MCIHLRNYKNKKNVLRAWQIIFTFGANKEK